MSRVIINFMHGFKNITFLVKYCWSRTRFCGQLPNEARLCSTLRENSDTLRKGLVLCSYSRKLAWRWRLYLCQLWAAMQGWIIACASRSAFHPVWRGWGSAAASSWCAEARPPAAAERTSRRTAPARGCRHPTPSQPWNVNQRIRFVKSYIKYFQPNIL